MKLKSLKITGTTAAGGTATLTSERPVVGRLYAVQWIDGDLADGVDAVFTCQGPEVAITLLTLTDANNDGLYYPRHATCDNAGAALTVTEDSPTHCLPLLYGKIQIAVSSGGATKTGGAEIFYFDEQA